MWKRRTFFQQKQTIITTTIFQRAEKKIPRDAFATFKDKSKLYKNAIRVSLGGTSVVRSLPVSPG